MAKKTKTHDRALAPALHEHWPAPLELMVAPQPEQGEAPPSLLEQPWPAPHPRMLELEQLEPGAVAAELEAPDLDRAELGALLYTWGEFEERLEAMAKEPGDELVMPSEEARAVLRDEYAGSMKQRTWGGWLEELYTLAGDAQ